MEEPNNKPRPYQPYTHDSEGTLVENRGVGATEPWIPNGWAEWTNGSTSTFGKKGNGNEK